MRRTIYLVRHGETDCNRQGIIQGSGIDAPLNRMGEQQAAKLYAYYGDLPFSTIYTSSLQRAQQTVQAFVQNASEPTHYIITPDINEISWGVHEGLKGSAKRKLIYAQLIKQWREGQIDARITDGESARELRHRLKKFLRKWIKNRDEISLVCSHGRAIRCMICLMKQRPLRYMEEVVHHNTGVFIIHYENGRFSFEKENCLAHLDN